MIETEKGKEIILKELKSQFRDQKNNNKTTLPPGCLGATHPVYY